MRRVSPAAPALAVVAAALLSIRLAAQAGPDTTLVRGHDETAAQALFGQLMSPFCRGLTLAACPSPGADSLRRDIGTRLDAGESPRAIKAAYAADWGEQMLGAPPVRRWGIVLWTLPGAMLVVGGLAVALWLRTQNRRMKKLQAAESLGGEVPTTIEPALLARLEAELEAFEKGG